MRGILMKFRRGNSSHVRYAQRLPRREGDAGQIALNPSWRVSSGTQRMLHGQNAFVAKAKFEIGRRVTLEASAASLPQPFGEAAYKLD
jgi:hypothetical protein